MQVNSTAHDLANPFTVRAPTSADSLAASLATRGADFASLLRQKQTFAVTAPAPQPAPTPVPPQPVAAPPAPQAAAGAKQATPQQPTVTDEAGDAPRPASPDAPPAASTEPASATNDTADASAAPANPANPADAAKLLARLKTRAADTGTAAKGTKTGKADAAPADAAATTEKAKTKTATDAPDPTLAGALLPTALPLPVAPPRRDAAAAAGDAKSGSDADRTAPRPADTLGARQDAAAQDTSAVAIAGAASADAPAAVTPSPDFAAMLADTRADPKDGARRSAVDGIGSAAGLTASFAPAPTTGTAAAQPVDVPTPVNSPDFAQHLGVQLSVLAKDGVQHAELHLNPADMGPVSVQITLDGTQARVDFGADVAATRQALEAGLPQLAGALADAGFTLAGGGVSQHAAGNGGGNGEGGDASARGDGSRGGRTASNVPVDSTAGLSAARRNVRIGGLDLYA